MLATSLGVLSKCLSESSLREEKYMLVHNLGKFGRLWRGRQLSAAMAEISSGCLHLGRQGNRAMKRLNQIT